MTSIGQPAHIYLSIYLSIQLRSCGAQLFKCLINTSVTITAVFVSTNRKVDRFPGPVKINEEPIAGLFKQTRRIVVPLDVSILSSRFWLSSSLFGTPSISPSLFFLSNVILRFPLLDTAHIFETLLPPTIVNAENMENRPMQGGGNIRSEMITKQFDARNSAI